MVRDMATDGRDREAGSRDERIRDVLVGVYAAGVAPLMRGVGTRWAAVPERPVRAIGAAAVTLAAVPVAVVYVLLATIVPLTVLFLLVITSPVLVWIAVLRLASPASPQAPVSRQ